MGGEMNQKIRTELNQNKSLEWIQTHDEITLTGNSFDEKNEYDWWKQNCLIRQAFNQIKEEINIELKKGIKLSNRIVSTTKIAKLAMCSRGTLLHPNRKKWVQDRKNELLNLMNRDDVENNVVQMVSERELIKELKQKLSASRDECAKWVKSSFILEKKNTKLEKKLYHIEVAMKQKNEKIRQLQSELRETLLKEKEQSSNLVEFPTI